MAAPGVEHVGAATGFGIEEPGGGGEALGALLDHRLAVVLAGILEFLDGVGGGREVGSGDDGAVVAFTWFRDADGGRVVSRTRMYDGDTFGHYISRRHLLYVPTGEDDPLVVFADSFNTEAFFDALQKNGLNRYAGKIAPRNAFNSDWWTWFDLRVEQEFPAFRETHKFAAWIDLVVPFCGDYVEANAWQFTWFVPHDVAGLLELMGQEEFNRRLLEGFVKSEPHRFHAAVYDGSIQRVEEYYINHGNQPNMQAAYLFNYSGKPWETQRWVRAILDKYYGTGPVDGYPGDEDQGQMGVVFCHQAASFQRKRDWRTPRHAG